MDRTVMIIVAVLLLAACGTQKKVVDGNALPGALTEAEAAQRLDAVTAATGAWGTMRAAGALSVKGGTSFSSAVQVRMVRDSALYISLRPLLGIEAGRLLIRDDSLFVVNKLQKQYLAEPVSLLTAGIPATVGMMQDIFLGRPFVIGSGSLGASRRSLATITAAGENYRLAPVEQPREFNYAFACNALNQVVALTVAVAGGAEAYSVDYADVRRTLAGNIAHSLRLATRVGGNAFALSLSYDQITWNEAVDTHMTIPAGYTRLDARALMHLLGS